MVLGDYKTLKVNHTMEIEQCSQHAALITRTSGSAQNHVLLHFYCATLSVVYTVVVWLCVYVCFCHTPVLYQNG